MPYRMLRRVGLTLLIASSAALMPKAGAEATQTARQESGANITFADGRIAS